MSKSSRRILFVPILLLVAGVSLGQTEAAKTKSASAGGGKKFTVLPAADLKWAPLKNAPPGPMMAVITGDPEKGAYTAMEKFPAGFSAPLHTHTATHKIVVISGTWIHGEPGKADARLGPGSYLVQPSGMKHTTACDAASECVFFIESSAKFDLKLVEEKKTAEKK